MENQNRTLFGIGGIGGMLIATVLLLSILAVLTYLGIIAQQKAANDPFMFERSDLTKLEMKSTNNKALEAELTKSKE